MDCLEEKIKLRKLRLELDELWKKLDKRRAELREKDLERRKKEFDRMPKELRTAFESVGWSPYQEGKVIRRTCGEITVKK